ncbi:phospholipase C/P1 nuclease [Guyanagaster necrorhizus]|uniref:Phospholipase C/P1 nuclease n=1 Tax=Guyanagaster necrorhizus TaxID=856835 RepID=A0A9P7W1A3_9AGAR|nr:phospholipase C/P1 nuclease [Guyanagaster necrorhizus MCA 3950]KAG7450729.1 phospholipase C/P1 nuclease [Guyanagaster necrorhizus MCA 3950]
MWCATLTAVFVSLLPKVHGWGASGHEAVGAIAQQFLASEASSFVASTLDSGETLSSAAPWADDVRSESAFAWSAPLHFVDAEDDPPSSCSVSESRDCSDGECILTAIANYTSRVVDDSLSHEQIYEALKFLDHFIGDIGQPLHVEAFELGGNDIKAKCGGSSTNLQDSGLINKRLKADFGSSVATWANTLVTRIKSGEYANLTSDWISCSSTTEQVSRRELRNVETDIKGHLASRSTTPLECPHIWAVEANELNCEFVFTYTQFSDLCSTSYYDGAIPLIELQLAKQGFRLAAWLNVLFDGSPNL